MKNADEFELRSIATDPDDIHMYNVADFSFLLDIVDNLTDNLCNSVKGPGMHDFTPEYVPHWVIKVKDATKNIALDCKEAVDITNKNDSNNHV